MVEKKFESMAADSFINLRDRLEDLEEARKHKLLRAKYYQEPMPAELDFNSAIDVLNSQTPPKAGKIRLGGRTNDKPRKQKT